MTGAGSRSAAEVRRLHAGEVTHAADVLADAFDDDPVAAFIFRAGAPRARALRRFFRIQLQHLFLPHGEVWTVDAPSPSGSRRLAGVAMWSPADHRKATWRDALRLVPVLPAVARGPQPVDALRLLAAVEEARPRRPLWYLATLGTAPELQRQGYGSALLGPVLRRADEEGREAYLESSKESNIAFYARHRFEVVGEVHAPGGGPTLWLMLRPPRPPEG